jgi:hypothetical protein
MGHRARAETKDEREQEKKQDEAPRRPHAPAMVLQIQRYFLPYLAVRYPKMIG